MSLFGYIKSQVSILDVVGEYVSLKPAGNYHKGPCPFHSEKDASFTVSPDKQIFYCFGCHASGDVIGFIAKVENMSQMEAARFLIEQHHVQVPADIMHAQSLPTLEQINAKERYFQVCQAVGQWAHKALLTNKPALQYLKDRALKLDTIKLFSIGYLPSGTAALNIFIKDMVKQGILLKDLLDHGILMEGRTSGHYSPFEERILFPIKNNRGQWCGFGGRIFKAGDERPKYYNSKESDGFEKGKLLFGLDIAKKALQERSTGFLVEGNIDCLMMIQQGYPNTIATLGTACTIDHLKMLSRLIHTLFVLYDGDAAGQKAMLRLTELCWGVNMDLKIISLPTGHDPASFLSQSGDLEPLIQHAQDIITFFINASGAHFSGKPLSQKMSAVEKIIVIISRLNDQFKQDLLLHHTAEITQMPFASLKKLMTDTAQKTSKTASFEKSSPPISPEKQGILSTKDDTFLLEEKIISAIINHLKIPASVHDLLPYFSERAGIILKKLDNLNDKQETSVGAFLDTLDAEDLKQWVIQIMMQHDGTVCYQMLDLLLARFYKYHWHHIVRNVKEEIVKAEKENNKQRVQEVLEHFGNLKRTLLQNRGLKQ